MISPSSSQSANQAAYNFPSAVRRFGKPHWSRKSFGWLLLLLSFLVGAMFIPVGSFTDEADTFAVASLMTRGDALYGDIFSHHFPFSYYWAAAVIKLFGHSIVALRLSLLVFYLGSFTIATYVSQYYLALPIASLMWSLIGFMYFGNMLLYSMFTGSSLVVVFAVCLAVVSGRRGFSTSTAVTIGVFASIALLSGPLSVYAIGVALICLALSPNGFRYALVAAATSAIVLGLYAAYLSLSGDFGSFLDDAIVFNSQIYAKFVFVGAARLDKLFWYLTHGLDTINPAWYDTDAMRPLTYYHNYGELDRWLFTGALFRVSVLVTGLVFLISPCAISPCAPTEKGSPSHTSLTRTNGFTRFLDSLGLTSPRRRMSAGAFVYFFAAALLVIEIWDFRAAPFIMVAVVCLAGLVSGEWRDSVCAKPLFRWPGYIIGCVLGGIALWLVFRTSLFALQNRQALLQNFNLDSFSAPAHIIQTDLACGQDDVALAYYPGDPLIYWVTQMRPVAGYLFMYPWVAEMGQADVIASLDEDILAVVFVRDMLIWDRYSTNEYLKPLLTFLDDNYVAAGDGWYVSPALYSRCQQ